MENNLNSIDIAVYSKRWLILAAFSLTNLLVNFGTKSFAVANQIYAEYFDVSLAVLDWFSLAIYLGAVFILPVFAWLFFYRMAKFRYLSIMGSSALLLSYFIIVLSVQFPHIYPLLIMTNLLQGVTLTVSVTAGPAFAVVWFPDHQVGLAIAIDLFGFQLGSILGALLPPVFLSYPPSMPESNSTSINTFQNVCSCWVNETHKTMLLFYIPCLIGLLALVTFFISFMTDQPLKAPTYAMGLKRISDNSSQATTKTFEEFITTIKSLHFDMNFVLCTLALSVTFSTYIVLILHATTIAEHLDINGMPIHNYLSSDIGGGILVTIYTFTSMVFGFASAKISSKWKKYRLQSVIGLVFNLFALLGLILSFHYKNFKWFCVFLILFSFGTRLCVIPLLEVVTRHTYPIDEIFVSVLVGAYRCLIIVLAGEIARIISIYIASIGLLIYLFVCGFISFVFALIIDPKDKRREEEIAHELQETSQETDALLPM